MGPTSLPSSITASLFLPLQIFLAALNLPKAPLRDHLLKGAEPDASAGGSKRDGSEARRDRKALKAAKDKKKRHKKATSAAGVPGAAGGHTSSSDSSSESDSSDSSSNSDSSSSDSSSDSGRFFDFQGIVRSLSLLLKCIFRADFELAFNSKAHTLKLMAMNFVRF